MSSLELFTKYVVFYPRHSIRAMTRSVEDGSINKSFYGRGEEVARPISPLGVT